MRPIPKALARQRVAKPAPKQTPAMARAVRIIAARGGVSIAPGHCTGIATRTFYRLLAAGLVYLDLSVVKVKTRGG